MRRLQQDVDTDEQTAARTRGTLTYARDIVWFHDTNIHIIRPEALANWTRTAAPNDAVRIYGETAEARRAGDVDTQ